MRDILYLLAIVLLLGWAFGFLYFSLGAFIHILLVLAIIAILFRVIQGERI